MRVCACVTWLLPLILLSGAPVVAEDETAPTRAEIERDLVLEATLVTPKTVQPGEPVRVRARIVNRSETRTFRLVRPGDGSESGWREPHVFLRAEYVGPRGIRTPVPEKPIGRCGLFDADWHKGVLSLAPGKSLEIGDWLPSAHHVLDFQREATVELRLHYRYTRGEAGKGGRPSDSPAGTGRMGDVPAFELVSAPLRFSVVRLVDIRLETTGTLTVGEETRLSDVLTLHVKNLGTDPVLVSGAELDVRFHGLPVEPLKFQTQERIAPTVERKTPALRGKATRTWSGRPAWNELPDWRVHPTSAGRFQIVAVWTPTGGKARYVSAPVEVRVLPR